MIVKMIVNWDGKIQTHTGVDVIDYDDHGFICLYFRDKRELNVSRDQVKQVEEIPDSEDNLETEDE